MAAFTVYWQPGCSSCLRAKEFLTAHGVDFVSVNVREDKAGAETLAKRGIMIPATIEDATLQDWRALMTVNGEGTFLGCKHAIAAMKSRGPDQPYAAIINFTSSLAINFTPQHAAYSASKAAVRALTKSAALHCGQAGYRIRVNNVQPGAVVTDMLRKNIRPGQSEDEYFREVLKRHPIGRLGTPKDIADAVVFLASDEAAYMTGADLTVDGGNTA